MSEPRKITVNENIIADSILNGETITEVLAREYHSEIQDRIKQDGALAQLDAFQHALRDAGIGRNTPVSKMIQTNDNEWLFPAYVDRRLRESATKYDILPHLVAMTQMLSGTSIRMPKLDMDDANLSEVERKRVAEGTDIPTGRIHIASAHIDTFKRGRAVEMTYEAQRRMSIDLLGRQLEMIANDIAGQQAGDAVRTLIEGDGNENPAGVVETAEIDFKSLLDFAIEYQKKTRVNLTTLIVNESLYKDLFQVTFNTDETRGLTPGVSFKFPQIGFDDIVIVYSSLVPNTTPTGAKRQAIGLNKDFALAKFVESGSTIRENDRVIRNQTYLYTFTETAGFGKINDNATMILAEK